MANVGVMDGAGVSVGGGVMDGEGVSVGNSVFVGESVDAEVDVSEGEIPTVAIAAIGVEGGDDATGAQEINIHVKQIPIHNCFCMAYILFSIQCGINSLLKNGIGLRTLHTCCPSLAIDDISQDEEGRALNASRTRILEILIHLIEIFMTVITRVECVHIETGNLSNGLQAGIGEGACILAKHIGE